MHPTELYNCGAKATFSTLSMIFVASNAIQKIDNETVYKTENAKIATRIYHMYKVLKGLTLVYLKTLKTTFIYSTRMV